MNAVVRPAEVGDVEAICDVAEAAWYAAYGGFLDTDAIAAGLGENYDPELIEAAVEHGEIAFHVADEGGVVGFASAERTWADEVELHTIYVHPDRWGEGIGSALLERIIEFARREGVDRIACGIFADNAVGVGFLESAGFRAGGTVDVEVGGEIRPEREYELPV